jgi:hypothetical protein
MFLIAWVLPIWDQVAIKVFLVNKIINKTIHHNVLMVDMEIMVTVDDHKVTVPVQECNLIQVLNI